MLCSQVPEGDALHCYSTAHHLLLLGAGPEALQPQLESSPNSPLDGAQREGRTRGAWAIFLKLMGDTKRRRGEKQTTQPRKPLPVGNHFYTAPRPPPLGDAVPPVPTSRLPTFLGRGGVLQPLPRCAGPNRAEQSRPASPRPVKCRAAAALSTAQPRAYLSQQRGGERLRGRYG